MEMPAPNASILSLKDQIVSRLKSVLPPEAVISGETETRAYECDGLTIVGRRGATHSRLRDPWRGQNEWGLGNQLR